MKATPPQNLFFYLALAAIALTGAALLLFISWIAPLLLKIIFLVFVSSVLLTLLFGQGAQMKDKAHQRLRQLQEECRLRQEDFFSQS